MKTTHLPRKWISPFLLLTSLLLALACGGGSGTAFLPDSSDDVDVSGTVESTGLSKPRLAAGDNIDVILYNLVTEDETTATVNAVNMTYTAKAPVGSYEIRAEFNGKKLRQLVSIEDDGSGEAATGNINLDTTTVATYLRQGDQFSSLTAGGQIGSYANIILGHLRGTIIGGNATIAAEIATMKTEVTNKVNALEDPTNPGFGDAVSITSPTSLDLTSSEIVSLGNFSTSNEKVVVLMKPSGYVGSAFLLGIDTSDLSQKSGEVFATNDYAISVHGRQVFSIGRYQTDHVQRYDVNALSSGLYSSPYDFGVSSNPYALIVGNNGRGIATIYGSSTSWIVDPWASAETSFKKGEIYLGDYDSIDGIPEVTDGIFLNGKYYLICQRLNRNNNWVVDRNGYMIVLNADGTEVDTGKAELGSDLKGIYLPARNPWSMTYSEATGLIYVPCLGPSASGLEFTGGVVTVDPVTYDANLLIDDDDGSDASTQTYASGNYGGTFSKVLVKDEDEGYLFTYSTVNFSYVSENALRPFNPTTGAVGNVITGFDGKDLRDMVLTTSGNLWISSSTGIDILDTSTDNVIQTIGTDTLGQIPDDMEIIRY